MIGRILCSAVVLGLLAAPGAVAEEPAQVWARHILIKHDESAGVLGERSRDEALALCNDLLQRARGGEEFARLAFDHSEDKSAKQGGDLGPFRRGRMIKQFEDAAFALEVGGISDVVETKYGFHIIQRYR